MSKKDYLLSNLREYSSDEIVKAISEGVVTMDELSKSGNLTPLMRKRIESKLAQKKKPADDTDISDSAVIAEEEQSAVINNGSEREVPEVVQNDENNDDEVDEEEEDIIDNVGMFKRPFSFDGRIRRMEYGISRIIYCIFYSFINGVISSILHQDHLSGNAVFFSYLYPYSLYSSVVVFNSPSMQAMP